MQENIFSILFLQIKLADLDDVDDAQPTCKQDEDCGIGDMRRLPCVKGRCQEYSDRLNVYHAHKLFYSLLPFEAPFTVQGLIAELTNNTGKIITFSTKNMLTLYIYISYSLF